MTPKKRDPAESLPLFFHPLWIFVLLKGAVLVLAVYNWFTVR